MTPTAQAPIPRRRRTDEVKKNSSLPGTPPASVLRIYTNSLMSFPPHRLERPCMEHMQYLLVRSHNAENQPFHHPLEPADDADHEHMSGHALMATAPPHSHIMHKPAEKYAHQMPEGMGTGALANLLHLSNRLPMDRDGEITPVMAWMAVLTDPRLGELDVKDIEKLKMSLLDKTRCYGLASTPCYHNLACITDKSHQSQLRRRHRRVRGPRRLAGSVRREGWRAC
jgi:hypothetical protein